MELNVRAFSIAVGTVIAAAFTVCAIFVAVAPKATTAFIGYLLHINLTGLTRALTWPSYIAGVLAVGRAGLRAHRRAKSLLIWTITPVCPLI